MRTPRRHESTAIVPAARPAAPLARPSDVAPEVKAAAAETLRSGKADSTWRVYGQVKKEWEAWCARHGASSLPAHPDTVLLYLADCAEGNVTGRRLGWSSLCLRRSWISQSHQLKNLSSPTWAAEVRLAFEGYRRRLKHRVPKEALTQESLLKMIATLNLTSLHGLRDRALMLVGFGAALRRSELCALTVGDISATNDGLSLFLPRSKTDQSGEGCNVGLERLGGALCPVRALEIWLNAAKLTSGPVFRGFLPNGELRATALCDREVARVVQRTAAACGIDASRVGGHSLRAGLATQLLEAGVGDVMVASRTRHTSMETLKLYYRPKSPTSRVIADVLRKGSK